ncbi:MAG: putative toxin-antitoxin system toxin component, PIN family [Nitrospirales bacterium]
MIRVVYDTNVLISAAIFPRSVPDQVLGLARTGAVILFTSQFILDEFRRVLEDKFGLDRDRADFMVDHVRSLAQTVSPPISIGIIQAKESDNRILECAVEARAHYLVTGDRKHILPLGEFRGIQILSPSDFLQIFQQ